MNLYNSNNYLRKRTLVEEKAMRLPKDIIDPDFIQKKEKAMRTPKSTWCDDFVQKKEKLFRIPTDRKSSSFVQKNKKLSSKIKLISKAKLTSISQSLVNYIKYCEYT